MAERLHRARVLLESEDYERLTERAHREGRSLSTVLREIVHDALTLREGRRSPEERQVLLEQLEELKRHRAEILAERGGKPLDLDVAELIRAGREERDEEILAAIRPSRP